MAGGRVESEAKGLPVESMASVSDCGSRVWAMTTWGQAGSLSSSRCRLRLPHGALGAFGTIGAGIEGDSESGDSTVATVFYTPWGFCPSLKGVDVRDPSLATWVSIPFFRLVSPRKCRG